MWTAGGRSNKYAWEITNRNLFFAVLGSNKLNEGMLTVTRKVKVLCNVLVRRQEGKVSLREPRWRWKDNIEVKYKEVGTPCEVAK